MARLTKYEPIGTMFPYQPIDESLATKLDIVHKLGMLEDIEEELGVDLVTLSKAFKNGIYSKAGPYGYCCLDGEPYLTNAINLELGFNRYVEYKHITDERATVVEEDALCLYEHIDELPQYSVRLKDYGKTWALTKEELL